MNLEQPLQNCEGFAQASEVKGHHAPYGLLFAYWRLAGAFSRKSPKSSSNLSCFPRRLLSRQTQIGDAAAAGSTVLEAQGAAVCFGDLAAENKTDSGAAGLCRKERNKEVRGIG